MRVPAAAWVWRPPKAFAEAGAAVVLADVNETTFNAEIDMLVATGYQALSVHFESDHRRFESPDSVKSRQTLEQHRATPRRATAALFRRDTSLDLTAQISGRIGYWLHGKNRYHGSCPAVAKRCGRVANTMWPNFMRLWRVSLRLAQGPVPDVTDDVLRRMEGRRGRGAPASEFRDDTQLILFDCLGELWAVSP